MAAATATAPAMTSIPRWLRLRLRSLVVKAFGGRATYRWSSSDGSIYATWSAPAVDRET